MVRSRRGGDQLNVRDSVWSWVGTACPIEEGGIGL